MIRSLPLAVLTLTLPKAVLYLSPVSRAPNNYSGRLPSDESLGYFRLSAARTEDSEPGAVAMGSATQVKL